MTDKKKVEKKIKIKAFAQINLRKDGKVLKRNDEIELPESQALSLVEKGWARIVTGPPAKESK